MKSILKDNKKSMLSLRAEGKEATQQAEESLSMVQFAKPNEMQPDLSTSLRQ